MADKDLQAALKTQFGTDVTSRYATPNTADNALANIYAPNGRYLDIGGVKQLHINPIENFTVEGYYSPKKPGELTIDPSNIELANRINKIYAQKHDIETPMRGSPQQTFVHEQQHMKDFEKERQKFPYGSPEKHLDEHVKNLAASDAIKETYNKYKEKYNLSDDYKTGKGFYAELARIQSTLPVGQNIFDTDLGKDLLKDIPELKSFFYKATAPYKGTEIHSADLPGDKSISTPIIQPKEKDKSLREMMEQVQNYVRNLTAP